jgi:geranylgeranyl reductase family protein
MERDVIVVGAGPGGSTTAMELAQKGYDVMLLDRKSYPRDKTCGDAVPAGAIEHLYDLGMKEQIEAQDFYKVDKLLISAVEGKTLEADLNPGARYGADSYIVPRLNFDVVLQQSVIDSGAEFCVAQSKGPEIEDGKVIGVRVRQNGSDQVIRSKMVVGADGVTSSITRALRTDRHIDHHRAVALRAYIEDLEEMPHQVEFYLYKGILPGYAWIFPIGKNRANIGLGMRLDNFRKQNKTLEDMLRQFMDMPAIKSRLKSGGILKDISVWQLNFGSQRNMKHAFDGALLVGDAAGLINPLTGGGIDNAIISGRLAAKTIDAALKSGNTSRENLAVYETWINDALWTNMRRTYYLQRVMGMFPFIVRWIVARATSDSHFAQAFLSKL